LTRIPTDGQTTVPFIPVIIFSGDSWCLYFDTTDSYLRFIPTNGQMTTTVTFIISGRIFSGGSKNIAGQTTVPFFPVVIFSGCNWCSYFDTNTNHGTYDRKKLVPEKRYSRLAGYFFWRVQITTRKKLRP
jgi:hypothetical protein